MARHSNAGGHSFSRTGKIRGREAEGPYAVIVQHREHTRVAKLRADGTADLTTEIVVPTTEVFDVKATQRVITGQRGTITLPGVFRRDLGIEEGTPLLVVQEDGDRLTIMRRRRLSDVAPSVELEDLVNRITPQNLHREEATGGPVGQEVW